MMSRELDAAVVHGLSRAAAAENGAHIYKFRVPDVSRNSSTEKGKKGHDDNENVGNASCKILFFEIYVLFRYVLRFSRNSNEH